jgi:plastocyanin
MKKYILVICLSILVTAEGQLSQSETGQISGSVFMPIVQRDRRTFRGRIYRNRLSSAKKVEQKGLSVQSSFIDVFISAHPISFQPELIQSDTVKILQLNANFIPRVTALTPGTEVEFINRDKFFHNVFSITPGERFNIGRKPTGKVVTRKFYQLGETKLFCDIHAQMNATIICLNTPFFTRAQPDGRYTLKGLPPGIYEIHVYHPDFSEIVEQIEIRGSDIIHRNFTLNR